MSGWEEPQSIEIPEGFSEVAGGHPLVAKLLIRRDITDKKSARAFLDPSHYRPASPLTLPGIDQAVTRIIQSEKENETVCVWGDFDVDGQTATALLVTTLQDLGIKVVFHMPLREQESHGVNIPILERIIGDKEQPNIDLLLTCDTGISSNMAVDFARNRNVDVIITDHHDIPEKLPSANVIINPKLLPDDHSLINLPGVAVAYKLVEELYIRYNRANESEKFLDLVALGIVSDVAYLAKDTRYLLQRGIKCLRKGKRTGLKAMYELIDFDPGILTEEHIGYLIGPRLNAVGRLDDAKKGVEFLITDDPVRAKVLALEFESLNARRKLLTNQVFKSALAALDKNTKLSESNVIVLDNPSWPAGIIGIVASRLVEKFSKPVILISSPDGETARGSARSIVGIDISAVISANQNFLIGYGGHPQAAGLTLKPKRITQFRNAISKTIGSVERITISSLSVDAYVPLADLSLELVDDIERLAPFGAGNPPLVFVSERLKITDHKIIGREDEHLSLILSDETERDYKVIWWNGAGKLVQKPMGDFLFDLAYSVRSSNYRGKQQIQIEWIDHRFLESSAPNVIKSPQPLVIDYRRVRSPIEHLRKKLPIKNIQIFAESDAVSKLNESSTGLGFGEYIKDRYTIHPAETLVIWTTPPGRFEFRTLLIDVSPKTVMYFCIDPQGGEINAFLEKLIGLVKFGLSKYQGRLNIKKLASAAAQREATLVKGLHYLEAAGYIVIISLENFVAEVKEGGGRPSPEYKLITEQLQIMLNETAAFRKYIKQIDLETIKTGL